MGEVFKIEKGISLPSRKYPIADMLIGDSFYVPLGDTDIIKLQNSVSTYCRYFSRKHPGIKFTVRCDAERKGVRVWRIA